MPIDSDATKRLEKLLSGPFLIEDVMQLVKEGADVNALYWEGNSLLHIFLNNLKKGGDSIITDLVKKYHADVDIKNAQGLTPLQTLLKPPTRLRHLMHLVRLGADPNVRGESGYTLLHFLAMLLPNYNVEPNIYELVQVHKADINSLSTTGETPLQIVMRLGINNAMFLVRLGADPNTQNADGDSLLEIFSSQKKYNNSINDKTIIELLDILLASEVKKITDSPENLKNALIQYLGQRYLKSFSQSFFHTNHPIAHEFKKYDANVPPIEKWQFLAAQYAKVPKHNGWLANQLRMIFAKAFDPTGINIANLDVATTSELLKVLAVSYFEEKQKENERKVKTVAEATPSDVFEPTYPYLTSIYNETMVHQLLQNALEMLQNGSFSNGNDCNEQGIESSVLYPKLDLPTDIAPFEFPTKVIDSKPETEKEPEPEKEPKPQPEQEKDPQPEKELPLEPVPEKEPAPEMMQASELKKAPEIEVPKTPEPFPDLIDLSGGSAKTTESPSLAKKIQFFKGKPEFAELFPKVSTTPPEADNKQEKRMMHAS